MAGYRPEDLERLLQSAASARVQDLMERKNPAVAPRATVRDLLYRMITEERSAFVVWEDGPVGTVTCRDAIKSYAAGASAKARRVSDLMGEASGYAVAAGAPALPVLLWMVRHDIPMVAVMEGEEFRGIFSPSRALAQLEQRVEQLLS